MSGERFIGIDVGGTKVVSTVLEDGTFTTLPPVPTRTDSPNALLDQMIGQIESCGAATAVCIGLPSIVEWSTGTVRHSVNLPFRDVPLRTLLSERVGIPVYVDNDASCAALAEASDGGRIVVENLVMLTVGTGVGGGLVLNGRVYRSQTSAAEMGHMLIGLDLAGGAPTDPGPFPQPGSLETLAAGRALDRLAVESAREYPKSFLGRRLAKGEDISGHDAVEGAQNGDVHCQHVIRVHGERLGIGIANMINLFDPDEVVIGGGVSLAGDLLLVPAERTARRHTVPGAGGGTTHPPRAVRTAGGRVRCRDRRRAGMAPPASQGADCMKIACAFDHAGFPLKPVVLATIEAAGHEPVDLGTWSTDPVDYPDTARTAAEAVRAGDVDRAVVVCGSGAGVAVAACKVPGIRACTAHDTYTAHQAVEHDDVNVLCLGARVVGPAYAAEIIAAYAGAQFSGEERHVRRLGKIEAIEREYTAGE